MSKFVITCEHKAEECDALSAELESLGTPAIIKGRDFFCSCPYGHHGGWVAVEAVSAADILSSLAPLFRSHANVYEVEAIRFE